MQEEQNIPPAAIQIMGKGGKIILKDNESHGAPLLRAKEVEALDASGNKVFMATPKPSRKEKRPWYKHPIAWIIWYFGGGLVLAWLIFLLGWN